METKGFFGRLFDLSFNEFITTKIITALYVCAMLGSGVWGLTILFGGFATKSFGGILAGLVLAPIAFLVGTILARIWLETLIVLFRIAENTAKIATKENP
ncbi:MAG TPA: DUF4282 domain-containing protein [Kiritimatiellia bacterium]|nr:DUF4282 domain-containing protein [Kiritimatiellia bacterium]